MSTESDNFTRKARKNERVLLRAFASVSGKAIALATGWSDSKVSRFFNEGNAEGVTEVACFSRMLVEMGLQVVPAHYRMFDPKDIDTLLSVSRMTMQHIKPHHLIDSADASTH